MRRRISLAIVSLCLAMVCLAQSAALAQGQATGTQSGDWWSRAPEFNSRFYGVKTDLPKEQAVEMAQHMDATCASYVEMFSNLPVRVQRVSRLGLYLFNTRQDYYSTLPSKFNADPSGSAGMCITRGSNISLVGWLGDNSVERLKEVMQHEGFHQFARHLFGDIPPWANEGIAEIFAEGVVVGERLVVGEFSRDRKQYLSSVIRQNQHVPFEQLFAIEQREWNTVLGSRAAQTNYWEAWSLIHYLLFSEEGKHHQKFLNFLVALNRTDDWRAAFVAGLGVPNFKELEDRWKEYVLNTPSLNTRELICRLEFLAAGQKHLRDKERSYTTLDELRQALEKESFQHTLKLYGQERQISAVVPTAFEVPLEDAPAKPARLELATTRPASTASKIAVAPPKVTTVGLFPYNFEIAWTKRGTEYQHSIVAVPAISKGKPRAKTASSTAK